MQSATEIFSIKRYQEDLYTESSDLLAVEQAIALVYNGVSHVVMFATPQDLEDFALGFSLTEGIIENFKQIYDIEMEIQENGIAVQLGIDERSFSKLKERRRNLTGRTGCGLCGAENLEQIWTRPIKKSHQTSFSEDAIKNALQTLTQNQVLQKQTGSVHACAWADQAGDIKMLREDVGRHNALDKLLGALAKVEQISPATGFVVTTSRASFEMVQKTASFGIPLLVALSAPTALAITLAKQYGISLIGFARESQWTVYT